MNGFTLLFLAVLLLGTVLQWWLAQRQINAVTAHQHHVPEAFSDKISLAEHQKAAVYTRAKTQMGQWLLLLEVGLLLLWTLGGLLDGLDQAWRSLAWSPLWTGVAVMLSLLLIGSLIDLPVAYYRTFVIENRFGFNRSTRTLFFTDALKSLGLSLVIGVPLLTLVLWLMNSMGAWWWLWVWGVWLGFTGLMLWAFPTFIEPLFNSFTPLAHEALRTRIEQLLTRNGFSSEGIFVMDGSRRSGHGNAYFTGFGKHKRIVFYDTLINDLSPAEVEAVLAHEIGHFKHKHVQKRLLSMMLFSLAGLALLAWLMGQAWFYQGLGVSQPSTYMALLLFMLVSPVFSLFLSPLLAGLSRRHEFEADAFAAAQSNPQLLSQALVKMYKENAATLTPDPLYSAFYDSHPPAPVRVAQLGNLT